MLMFGNSRFTSLRASARFAFIFAALLVLIAGALHANEPVAVIEEVDGTVEIRMDGGDWEAVEVGDVVPVDARISTGFGASAVLAVGENATITVSSLTRIAIRELAVEEGVERSDMDLEVGRIDGDVRGVDAENTEFNVRSPVATASVRGTSFGFDGEELWVGAGSVALSNALGQETTVGAGEESSTDGVSSPEDPAQARASRGQVSSQTRGGGAESSSREESRVRFREELETVNLRAEFQ